MKKATILIAITFWTINLFAQFETGLKLGASRSQAYSTSEGKAGFYYQGYFGYRFLKDRRVSVISSFFIDKSAYTVDNLTFGGMFDSNGNFTFETSTLTYQLYAFGVTIGSEIKLLNPSKKTNFYITPSFGYRRIFSITQESSNPNLDVSKHPDVNQGIIIDWGLELGVKLKKFKVGVALRDVFNENNKDMSSFVITNAYTISVSYLFNMSFKKKEVVE